jgi:predicted phosphodiesterase
MKLHILSDLHFEFSYFESPDTDADVIVLAGDIDKGNKGVYWARRAFPDKPILYVPGNHEFYGTRRDDTLDLLHIAGKQNGVHLLDDGEMVFEQERVRFLGCTLWTDFRLFGEQKMAMEEGQRRLADFRVIREGSEYFTPQHSIELHQKSLAWLKAKLDEPFNGKTVVITHHLPSMLSVVNRYKNDLLSACFASELNYLFGKMNLWIHGHTHDNRDYESNGTRVICNPRGYVTSSRTENLDFIPGLVIKV